MATARSAKPAVKAPIGKSIKDVIDHLRASGQPQAVRIYPGCWANIHCWLVVCLRPRQDGGSAADCCQLKLVALCKDSCEIDGPCP